MDLILAQVTTPDILPEYLKYGVLGLTALVALIVAWYKDRALYAEKERRIEDASKAIELARTSSETLTKWTIAQENQNKAMADMARAVERLGTK